MEPEIPREFGHGRYAVVTLLAQRRQRSVDALSVESHRRSLADVRSVADERRRLDTKYPVLA